MATHHKVIKIPVKDYYQERIDRASEYTLKQAVELQRSIVNSNFYVGSDYKLYRIGSSERNYADGVAKHAKEILDEVK